MITLDVLCASESFPAFLKPSQNESMKWRKVRGCPSCSVTVLFLALFLPPFQYRREERSLVPRTSLVLVVESFRMRYLIIILFESWAWKHIWTSISPQPQLNSENAQKWNISDCTTRIRSGSRNLKSAGDIPPPKRWAYAFPEPAGVLRRGGRIWIPSSRRCDCDRYACVSKDL